MSNGVFTLGECDEERRARQKVSEQAEVLYNLGATLKKDGHFTAAAIAMRRAIGVNPECGMLWNGVGTLYWDMGDYEGALDAYNRSIALGHEDSMVYSNMGMLHASMKQFDVAEQYMQKALAIKPGDLHTRWNLSHLFLEKGDWERGFKEYEIRPEYRGTGFYPKLPYPMWNGSDDLTGKTIFVQGEQGIGDKILASRYLHWLHSKYDGLKIKAIMGDEMTALLWSFSDFVEFLPEHIGLPKDVDYGVYLFSLPLHHGTTVDNVYPDPGLIRQAAVNGARFVVAPPRWNTKALKVGIAWTGNPEMQRNAERSIPFHLMLELEENPNIQLYSLQFGCGSAEIAGSGAGEIIFDLVPKVADKGYAGTAAVLQDLDLCITVCTSLAHLAGAVGIPTWVLLCQDPYWVWLREGDRSVWYDSVKLYRQLFPGDWGSVIDIVKQDLNEFALVHKEKNKVELA